MKYLARVHTGSEPNDNIKLANWTPNNGPFSYNFRQFIVQFTFRSREIEFFGKIFRVSGLTLCHQGFYFSSKICFTFATKRTSIYTCRDFSHFYTIKNKPYMQSLIMWILVITLKMVFRLDCSNLLNYRETLDLRGHKRKKGYWWPRDGTYIMQHRK